MAKRIVSRRASRRLHTVSAARELSLNHIINVRLETQRGQLLRARSLCNLVVQGLGNADAFQRSLPCFIDDIGSAVEVVSRMLSSVLNELDTVNLLKDEGTEVES